MAERTIIVDGSKNLFRVAAEEYNDPLMFIAILERNFLESPFLKQPQKIILPETPVNVGGMPNQDLTKGSYQAPDPLNYPYSQTSTIAKDGINTLQYSNGRIVSWTTGKGTMG